MATIPVSVGALVRRPAPSSHAPLPPDQLLRVMLQEARRHHLALAATFAGIAVVTLAIGLFLLPKTYSSSTTILARESDIIQPLLEGRAVSTGIIDRAGMARQVIFSRKVMERILAAGGWLGDDPSPVEQDRLIEQIQERTAITSPRQDLVNISYRDSDPERTFEVTREMARLFIDESLATKERESREAFEFIDNRVREYHRKLTEAEQNLQAYRTRNVDAQPGSAADVNARISALRGQVEQARMSLLEYEARAGALSRQLSGESAVTAVQTRDNLYQAQAMELQSRIDTLLLNYTEQHPDVVRLRHQLADAERNLLAPPPGTPGSVQAAASPFGDTQLNPQYQELRSELNLARREAAGVRSRLVAAQSLLSQELGRSRRVAASEGALAELTRDYEVNRDLYQDLLHRRENARVSMLLDRENRGLTLRVQDPAVMPLRPVGLRLMHFALGGFLLALAVPLGLLFMRARFDMRVRASQQLERLGGLPLLTVVPRYRTHTERRRELAQVAVSISLVASVFVFYGLSYGFKQLSLA